MQQATRETGHSATTLEGRAQLLRGFDELPDSALVDITVVAAVQGVAESTAWLRAKKDPDHPQPIRVSTRCTRFRAGGLRRYVAIKAGEAVEA